MLYAILPGDPPMEKPLHGRVGIALVSELCVCPVFVVRARARAGRNTANVVSIVGSGREPLPLRHSEIVSLREGLDLRRAEPHPYLNIGERARIRSGPLAGFQGIVMRKNNGLRVILTLQEIMKSVAVEVEEYDLEPIGESSVSKPDPGRA